MDLRKVVQGTSVFFPASFVDRTLVEGCDQEVFFLREDSDIPMLDTNQSSSILWMRIVIKVDDWEIMMQLGLHFQDWQGGPF